MHKAKLIRITFLPDGRSADVDEGTPLLDAADRAGVRLVAPCNGKGTCGKCEVRFEEGAPKALAEDQDTFAPEKLAEGWRLACMHSLTQQAVVYVTPATLGKVDFGPSLEGIELNPNIRKVHARLESVRQGLTWSDVMLWARPALNETPTLEVLKTLAAISCEPGVEVTAVVRSSKVIALEPGDTRLENYGLALDIGTTTVAGSLLDLNTGEELAQRSVLNRQSLHGADVMSRLTALNENLELLPVLQRLAVQSANEILEDLLSATGVRRDRVYEVTVAGNSCMHHFFLGLDALTLAFAPYDARVLCPLTVRAADVGLNLSAETAVYMLPNIESFIGGDAVGATLAVGLHRSTKIRCLADIGTNGEVVLGSKDRLIACSTPAGPAFEGMSISCGMMASEGAIDSVSIGDHVTVRTVGNAKPRGLAGSGLIDAAGQLRRSGILAENGKIRSAVDVPSLSARVAERLMAAKDGQSFVLARSRGTEIVLTQRDVRELQLAKAVIFAAIETLKSKMGVSNEDIEEFFLAGTFGSYLRIASARDIGLVPRLPQGRIRAVGNAALVGAKMCLLSMQARAEAEELARRVEHVDLPGSREFQDFYVKSMFFPPLEK